MPTAVGADLYIGGRRLREGTSHHVARGKMPFMLGKDFSMWLLWGHFKFLPATPYHALYVKLINTPRPRKILHGITLVSGTL